MVLPMNSIENLYNTPNVHGAFQFSDDSANGSDSLHALNAPPRYNGSLESMPLISLYVRDYEY